MPFPVALAASAIGGLFKLFGGGKQRREANKIVIPEANYEISPYAQKRLGEAERIRNSRMPGFDAAEQGILGSQANTIAGANRNASSGGQALALLAASQGQADKSINALSGEQNAYSMNMLNNENNANDAMTNEMDKVYQDKVRKQMLAIQQKQALMGAAGQNLGGGMNDLINGAWAGTQMGLFGKKKDG